MICIKCSFECDMGKYSTHSIFEGEPLGEHLIYCTCALFSSTVDPVINDPVTNDLLSPTTFFSCTDHFSIVNDL